MPSPRHVRIGGSYEVFVSFYRCGEENYFERHRSRIPIGKEQRNIKDAKKHLINFLGISQMATSLRMGNFVLKLYRLAGNAHRENEEFTCPYATLMGNGSSTPLHVIQKIINWSDKKLSSTRSSEDKDPEIAIIDEEPGASDSARKTSRKGKQKCLEDKEVVQNILRDNKVVRNWRGSCFWSPALGQQGGVMTCFSDSFDYEFVQWKRDTSGRVVSVAIKVNNYCINIVNIYAPTNLTERKVFFGNLHEFFLPSDAIVIAGDFNCYEYQTDKTGGNLSCAKYLANFRSTFHLIDAWHRLNPRSRQCTWFNSDFSIGSRLDKIFVSQSLFSFVSKCEIKPFCLSDHDI
ncbi:Transposon TX1 uncharacterized 149 kDa protein, partial [Acropora cervicornis]